MTTRLFLVRHGATDLTAEDRFSGAEGVELSEQGRAQAERLGLRLRAEGIAAVYSSPLSRAMDTARIVSKGWAATPIAIDGLREISHGHWEGLQRKEVEARFAAEYAMWEQDPFTCAPSGGESGVAVLARALPAFKTIIDRSPGREDSCRLAQGDDPIAAVQPARHRRAWLPRSAGSGARVSECDRFQRSGSSPPHALQRHVALQRHADAHGASSFEVVGLA